LKTIIRLLVAALVIHACYRGAEATWRYYSFKDDVEQEARFGAKTSTSELQQRILTIADERGIEIDPADIVITKEGLDVTVAAAYYDYVEVLPRLYTHEQLFEFEVNVHPVRPLTVDDLQK
jgi:hypothetical protein